MTKDTELAWCAGLFDGEGNTNIRWEVNKTHPKLRVQVPQKNTNKEVLHRFKEAVGVGSVNTYKSQTCSTGFMSYFTAYGKDARVVIALLFPYLSSAKKKQADDAITIRDAWEKSRKSKFTPILEIAK